ncbi:MAG: hypothetical protein FWC70_07965 [Defluviitaleaceae bacterium]|nr:hypothetical protein [Defluviitaleaceae bacterium]
MFGRCSKLRRENDTLRKRSSELVAEHHENEEKITRQTENIRAMLKYVLPIVRNYNLPREIRDELRKLENVKISYGGMNEDYPENKKFDDRS